MNEKLGRLNRGVIEADDTHRYLPCSSYHFQPHSDIQKISFLYFLLMIFVT